MRIAPLLPLLAVLTLHGSTFAAAATQPSAAPSAAATRPAATRPAGPAPIYIDPATGFSIVPPKFTDNLQQRTVVFYAPAQNGAAATVNILVDPARTSRREYVDNSLRALRRNDARLNVTRELQVAGCEAELLDYEATLNVRRWRYLQLLVFTDDLVYIITCQSTVDTFDQYKDAFQKCLDSFRPPAK